MHPGLIAAAEPDKVAYVMADTRHEVTYGQLNDDSNRLARLFRDGGLGWGGHMALMLENHPVFFKV